MEEELEKALMPLYVELLDKADRFIKSSCVSCVQWGENFPIRPNDGIIFVGMAPYGWKEGENATIDSIFNKNREISVFARNDQMTWIEREYNGRLRLAIPTSHFWGIIKRVASKFYPKEWTSFVSWSNICKVSPKNRTKPSLGLYNAQRDVCVKIFKSEIEALSPKVVVMITGNSRDDNDWGYDFIKGLNGERAPEHPKSTVRDTENKCDFDIYEIDKVTYIHCDCTMHHKVEPYSECLIDIISGLNKV